MDYQGSDGECKKMRRKGSLVKRLNKEDITLATDNSVQKERMTPQSLKKSCF